MTETNKQIASPVIQHGNGLSLVWLVPLITLLIGAWLVYKTLSEQGPQITIAFDTAAGIEAGTTRIRYRDVEIGVVEALRFSEGHNKVLISAKMSRAAEGLLNTGTRFWVVKPRLTLREVTGLGTLLSGSYIELDPGNGKPQTDFIGLATPPVLTTADQGTTVLLQAPRLGSIGVGSPIYYQGIVSGEVLGYELDNDRQSVLIHAFIAAPYDELLRNNTRFWNVSGLDISVDADGFKLRTESIESLMFGGIAFETPASLAGQDQLLSRERFTLLPSREHVEETGFTKKVPFVLFFDSSVRGLSLDAPVEFRGIKIGNVRDLRLEYHSDDSNFRIPVLVEIEPERIAWLGDVSEAAPRDVVSTLVKRGLRARLQTGNLLTGQLFVELVMRPDSPAKLVDTGDNMAQLPTIPGELDELTSSIRGFLGKLNQVEIDRIAEELQGTLAGTNKALNHPDLDQAISDLSASVRSMKVLLGDLEKRSGNISKNVESALAAVAPALEQTGNTMQTLQGALKPGSQLHFRVIRMADELTETARAVREFVNLLEQEPEAVIFGKQEEP